MQIYFHSRLWSYLPRVPILVEGTVLQKRNIYNLWQNLINSVYSLRGWHYLLSGFWSSRII